MHPHGDNQVGLIPDLSCRLFVQSSSKITLLIIKHFNGAKENDNESLHIIDLNPHWN